MKSTVARMLVALAMGMPFAGFGQVSVSITVGPPPLPVYEQPPCPADGYIWTPGYWAWSAADGDYYWVPGTWVEAPVTGYLWTPGYWAFDNGYYRWRGGYWAEEVGFYGGIAYGFGYTGRGYQGGRWEGNHFAYNRSVNNVNTTVVHNIYNTTINNYMTTRVAYNGGPGGVGARPTPHEQQVQAARHVEPTPVQRREEASALAMPAQRASVNRGAPKIAATPRPTALEAPASDARREVPPRPVPPTAEPRAGPTPNGERTPPVAHAPAHEAAPPRGPAPARAEAPVHPAPQVAVRPAEPPRAMPQEHPQEHPRAEPNPRADAAPHPAAGPPGQAEHPQQQRHQPARENEKEHPG